MKEEVEAMVKAQAIAEKLFGGGANLYATEQIYDYLDGTNEETEAEFATDLKSAIESAGIVFKTDKPTPEQAFFAFRKMFDPATTLDDVLVAVEESKK